MTVAKTVAKTIAKTITRTFAKTLRAPAELADAQLARRDRFMELDEVAARYAVAITPAIAGLIDPADPHDPIARQFIPDARELELHPDESADPIGDEANS